MSDLLPLSPLTHRELNLRASEAVTKAGHRAISTVASGLGVTPGARDLFAKCAAEFDTYNGAAIVRCSVRLERAA